MIIKEILPVMQVQNRIQLVTFVITMGQQGRYSAVATQLRYLVIFLNDLNMRLERLTHLWAIVPAKVVIPMDM